MCHTFWMETAIRRHDEIFEEEIESRGDVIIKKIGDALMAVFPEPTHVVRGCVGSAVPSPYRALGGPRSRLRVRMWIDTRSRWPGK